MVCKRCETKGVKAVYWGEPGFSSHYRGKQHQDALRRKQPDSVLYRHILDCHEGQEREMTRDDFRMTTANIHRRPLTRQCEEGLELEHAVRNVEGGARMLLLNSKSEFYQPGVVRPAFGQGLNN